MEEALERQQEAAEARRARKEQSSPEDRERKVKEESLRLSRARIEEQPGRMTNPTHQAMLERALSDVICKVGFGFCVDRRFSGSTKTRGSAG
jgi:hypothetical protein